jgi:ElaB/YqjD/DUF883 family membrane-anchored ribosome-binding protein
MRKQEWSLARSRPVSFASERVIAQIKALAYDAESLLRATADQTGGRIAAVRSQVEASLQRARADVAAVGVEVVRSARTASVATDRYVRANPWQAVGIAVSVGFVLGRLSGRR